MTSQSIATILLPILFAGAFYAAVVAGDNGAVELVSTVGDEQREFDYFGFALFWPPTNCLTSTKCCAQNGCCRGANGLSVFTIHGLWPNYNDGSYPSCCEGAAFNLTQITIFQTILDTFWPALTCSNSKTCHKTKGLFWAHEWEKHGTCASPVTGEEYNYFLTTIGLYFTYNVTDVLFRAGYVPSNSEKYPSGGIIAAIENYYRATPQITCSTGYLKEVRLCFTKDFKFQNCLLASDCPEYVSLPELNATRVASQSVFGHESF